MAIVQASPLGLRRAVSAPLSRCVAWWSQTGSNRRPHACKARALPTELWPLLVFEAWLARRSARLPARLRPLGFAGQARSAGASRSLVGPGRVERPTSRLSGVRSNHLSYEPGSCSNAARYRTGAASTKRGRETKTAATVCRLSSEYRETA